MKKKKMNWFKTLDKIVTEIPVSEVMVREVKTLNEDSTVQDVVDLMAKHSIAGLMITNGDSYPVGIISEGDLIKKVFHRRKDPKKVKVKEVMSKKLQTIESDYSIGDTATLMEKHNDIYYQGARLRWALIAVVVQFIIMAVLLLMYINK